AMVRDEMLGQPLDHGRVLVQADLVDLYQRAPAEAFGAEKAPTKGLARAAVGPFEIELEEFERTRDGPLTGPGRLRVHPRIRVVQAHRPGEKHARPPLPPAKNRFCRRLDSGSIAQDYHFRLPE